MQLDHAYPDGTYILDSNVSRTLLEKISHPETTQPEFTKLVKKSYEYLFNFIIDQIYPQVEIATKSRMVEFHSEGNYKTEICDRSISAVCVDLARAGMIPSQLFYEELHNFLPFQQIRQDHVYAARKTNDKNEVIGIDISGSKIGGGIDNAFVFIPDPMGATGSTIAETIKIYKEKVEGKPICFITAHLIITPEYVKKIKSTHPDVKIFALRLDRGLSTKKALESKPGEFWDEEKGLNPHSYIVPGAGGVGEILNNSFV